jgi:hypothetical protein
MPTSSTSPDECSLAVAVPVDRDSFLRKLRSGSCGDFVHTFQQNGRGGIRADVLWEIYEPYAELVGDVVSEVKQLGVNVIVNAQLQDFLSLLSVSKVVTLVAHWRSARFGTNDIVDVDFVRNQILSETSALRACIDQLTAGQIRLLPTAMAGVGEIVGYLNSVLETGELSHEAGRLGALTVQQYAWKRKRESLMQSLPGLFRGGASVEFDGGFSGLDELVSRVPVNYAGALDLTVCNSVLLGEEIRRRCAHCIVLVNEAPASLDFRMAVYRQVIRSLSRRPDAYEDVVYRIRSAFSKRHK